MFENMNETQKYDLINILIEETKINGSFNLEDSMETDMAFENGLPYCPECGSTEYIFVKGYKCSGTVCMGCGTEEMDNDYY